MRVPVFACPPDSRGTAVLHEPPLRREAALAFPVPIRGRENRPRRPPPRVLANGVSAVFIAGRQSPLAGLNLGIRAAPAARSGHIPGRHEVDRTAPKWPAPCSGSPELNTSPAKRQRIVVHPAAVLATGRPPLRTGPSSASDRAAAAHRCGVRC